MRRWHKAFAFSTLSHIQQILGDLRPTLVQLVDRKVPARRLSIPVDL